MGQPICAALAGRSRLAAGGFLRPDLKTFFRPELAQGIREIYELHVDNEILQVRINEGEIDVWQGETRKADVIFQTGMPTYLGLLQRRIQPEEAIARGLIRIEGDPGALSRFLDLCGLPGSP
jgi:hypothetical protein